LKLGEYHLEHGAHSVALAVFSDCLSLLEPHDHNKARREKVAKAYWGKARALWKSGDVDEARNHGRRSLAIFLSLEHHTAQDIRKWLDAL
jgi:hypothetical protein